MATVDPQENIRRYLRELHSANSDNAFHSLIESDPSIIPLLIEEFRRETDTKFRNEILKVIGEFRLAETIPFFAERLYDEFWKSALDCLVMQASTEAVNALEHARARKFETKEQTDSFRIWLDEAIEQAKERESH
jgi:hypothetical protein